MYDIIKRYVDNENKNGLMLIDMPTGSGKTYSAIKYIFDACMDPQNKDRKYIFVTTLKKNLPYDDLQKWFNSIGKSELYQEKVLVIDSNMDSVVDGWSPEVESAIPDEIKKSDEYKNFQRDLSFVKRQREEKTLVMREFLDSIESNLREKTEPRFRRLVSDYLAKEYVTVEQRLYAVKTDKKWQWLGKLYPAVFTRDRQVLFLSMDKLLSIYTKQSVVLLSTRYIIQAIGRICRTNQKNKDIYIYADNNIVDRIDVSVINGRSFNPEFVALVHQIQQTGAKDPETISLEDRASLRAIRVNKEIKNMLNNDWTEAKIKKWKKLRTFVLEHPTASKEEAGSNFIITNFYVQLPEAANYYYYSQEEDFNNVSVTFRQDREHSLKVSEEGTKLRKLLQIPGARELFERNGWATSFQTNDYIMTPPLWNNIYKGALGEVVGKFLLEKHLHVTVKEIENPDIFEMFDYEIEGSSVYVDFKNWQEGTTEDKNTVIKKIAGKAAKCGCKCVVVANIYAEGNWDISEVDMENIHIVSLPCLVKETDGKLSYDRAAFLICNY